jgi:hypothetical protein
LTREKSMQPLSFFTPDESRTRQPTPTINQVKISYKFNVALILNPFR